jgi:hypothetical protein
LVYEAGELRYVRLGGREILRRVYVAVRDLNWLTVPATLSNLHVSATGDSFRIGYDAEHKQGDIDFYWKGTITGDAEGTVTFEMEGLARSTFLRNRIGFCVLHPVRECAGRACVVEDAEGRRQRGAFPAEISPHQPFKEMQAILHEVTPELWAELRFKGDLFEMEDQRNWTDASYKTYCTPLALPFPVRVEEGTQIFQSVTLSLNGRIPRPEIRTADERTLVEIGQSSSATLPRIGLGMASHGRPLGERELLRLKALNLSHLRLDLNLARPGYEDVLRRGASEAGALGLPLEVALFLSDRASDELEAFADVFERIRPTVCTWLVLREGGGVTDRRWVRLAKGRLSGYDAVAKFGGGTDAYFTDLNRERPSTEAWDLIVYSINPQVHAFDNSSLVETLAMQAVTAQSTRRVIGDLPLAISPVTLKPRFLPTATAPEAEPVPGELPRPVDVRQMSLFGAGWTMGSLKHLAESNVHSVTYYETSGWRGVMEREAGPPLPQRFRSLPGSVFPLYHVLADVGEFVGGGVVPTTSRRQLEAEALAVHKDGWRRVLLSNLTNETRRVVVQGLDEIVRVRLLDERNALGAMLAPESFRAREGERLRPRAGRLELTLLPYAVARIDNAKE